MALRIKSYPNMNQISSYDNVYDILPLLEELAATNGIGSETAGSVVGERRKESNAKTNTGEESFL